MGGFGFFLGFGVFLVGFLFVCFSFRSCFFFKDDRFNNIVLYQRQGAGNRSLWGQTLSNAMLNSSSGLDCVVKGLISSKVCEQREQRDELEQARHVWYSPSIPNIFNSFPAKNSFHIFCNSYWLPVPLTCIVFLGIQLFLTFITPVRKNFHHKYSFGVFLPSSC